MNESETETLVRKVGWIYRGKKVSFENRQFLALYRKLEDEGFGMLADKNNPTNADKSNSVVCPDGSIFTPEQIENYWDKKGGMFYSSENPEDVKMHKVRMYYLGFKS
jgi:hypothetical protein